MSSTPSDKIRLIGNSLSLCDVRCGPTEDKVLVDLDSGAYTLAVENDDESVSVTICKSGVRRPAPGADIGELSIDGGVLGAYDTQLFTERFGADAVGFYEWGESLFEATDAVQVYRDSIEPHEFACIPTSFDGIFRLTELTQGDSRVGVRLSATMPASQETDYFVAFQFFFASASTRVEAWLDPVYDDESILDTINDSLEEALGHDVDVAAVEKFISEIGSIELAVQIDEELNPGQSLDLSVIPDTWRSDSSSFCRFLREAMEDGRPG